MESDSWAARLSSISKHYQFALQSRSDLLLGFEEIDVEDDVREEFGCPFCPEYFDIVGLCSHIDDEHPLESKNGRKRRTRKSGWYSTLSLLRKELGEGNLWSLFGDSSCLLSLANAAPDPLLSSFILPMADELLNEQSHSSTEATPAKRGSDENMVERKVQSPPLSVKDQEERTKRSEFVHELMLCAIFEDKL
ncbi:DEHYDRATION-INDUCED 19 homolog 3-like protein [Drosera capensis]